MAQLHPRAVDGRRASFRAGRAAAHDALALLGCDDGPILVGQQREPVWPIGVVGSISHASGVGVALVAPTASTGGVGIDVEAIRPAPELFDQVPRPDERSWLDAIADVGERDAAVLELFSAKESIFKAFFPRVGEMFGFEAATLVRSPAGFTGAFAVPIDPGYPPDRSFDIVCLRHDDLVVTWLILPPELRGP
jgi:enterobactin synthetase component D